MTQKQLGFHATYLECLKKTIQENPAEYSYPVSEAEFVVSRMCAAIERGTFNHDGKALARTCRVLGIKHTRKAILEFWNS